MAEQNKNNVRKIADSKAVALSYDKDKSDAPKVVAKGEGLIAEKIRKLAEENGVPIREDNDLVELLAKIDIDSEIPTELYGVVAEVLSWIYKANNEMKEEISK